MGPLFPQVGLAVMHIRFFIQATFTGLLLGAPECLAMSGLKNSYLQGLLKIRILNDRGVSDYSYVCVYININK